MSCSLVTPKYSEFNSKARISLLVIDKLLISPFLIVSVT